MYASSLIAAKATIMDRIHLLELLQTALAYYRQEILYIGLQ
jgi:hypothetical protein